MLYSLGIFSPKIQVLFRLPTYPRIIMRYFWAHFGLLGPEDEGTVIYQT
jgi:uncharacterized protein Usg